MDEGHLGMNLAVSAKADSHSARSRLVDGDCASCHQTLPPVSIYHCMTDC